MGRNLVRLSAFALTMILARRARWNSRHNHWILQDVEVDRTQISGKVKIPSEIEFHPEDVALSAVGY